MEMSKEEVLNYLPHKKPFLFIDSVESISSDDKERILDGELKHPKEMMGLKSISNYYVSEDLDIFKGHFPGNPVLPGVIQIEMMAQCSTFVLKKLIKGLNCHTLKVALLKVENTRFRRPVKPDSHLKIISQCKKVRGSILEYDCQIVVEGEVMSETTILASHNQDIKI